MERCKNCKWWDSGVCVQADMVEDFDGKDSDPRLFVMDVRVADDHNLNVQLRTGPEFGCVKFEQK